MTGLFLVVLTATIVTLAASAAKTPILISKCSCKVGV